MMYLHNIVEKYWQDYWKEHGTFQSNRNVSKSKKYILDMFPYPSGAGLHVGHVEGYTATDILAKYYKMKGYDVFHPMGFDAFGLPAELHAIQTNRHPKETTASNIANFKEQLSRLGFGYDWRHEVNTTDPDYVRWTQWMFLQLFKKDLAYQAESEVNWCEELGTVLSNEEVIGGLSERGNHPVTKRLHRQWTVRITKYAERLKNPINSLDWPIGTKEMQSNWIGQLHDWIFSRQRYWGEPIPIYYPVITAGNPKNGDPYSIDYSQPIAVLEEELPLLLPDSFSCANNIEGPLASNIDWRFFQKDEKWFARETSTMPQWAGSCWYYLRYLDPKNTSVPFSSQSYKDWGPVDIYIGGSEHAVLHLLYARFWHMFLYDCGLVSDTEPFKKVFHQGMILGEDGQKMSKSRGNVIDPIPLIDNYGADVIRMYEMFMGPLQMVKPWQSKQIKGMLRLRNKIWKIVLSTNTSVFDHDNSDVTNIAIKDVTNYIENFEFNKAVSTINVLANYLDQTSPPFGDVIKLIFLIAPFAPHLAEESWKKLGASGSIFENSWPISGEIKEELTIELPIQVNGKIVDKVLMAPSCKEEDVKVMLKEKSIEYTKLFYVPGKIISIVT